MIKYGETRKNPTRKKIHGKIDDQNNVDFISSNVNSSRQEALLYVFEDNEAAIKMIIKGRSPIMRHVSRTHRVCKSGKLHKMGASALCTVDDANCFHMIRLELKTSVYEMNVTVVSTLTGCDVTTVQQHYKGSTSTPPRVARLCQIREAPF